MNFRFYIKKSNLYILYIKYIKVSFTLTQSAIPAPYHEVAEVRRFVTGSKIKQSC